jgi:hypothetical protein
MSDVALSEELSRLDAEIERLEARVAAGHAGVIDHILLEATRRTRATTRGALALDKVSIRPHAPTRRPQTRVDSRAPTDFQL